MSIYPWEEPTRFDQDLPEFDDCNAAVRTMAWSCLDICLLGRVSRSGLMLKSCIQGQGKVPRKNYGDSSGTSIVKWFITFFVVAMGWVFFRAPNFETAWQVMGQLFLPHSGVLWIYPFAVFIIIATALFHILKALDLTSILELPENAWYTPAVLFCLAWLVFLFHSREFTPFIYAQF